VTALRSDDGDPDLLDQAAADRNRIALAEPTHPTWMGDRLAAVDARVRAQYQLDLRSAWPRLWLLLADAPRAELRAAATAVDSAARLCAWALLYLLVGLLWWPAAVIGAVTVACAVARGRSTVMVYAELVEAVVDLHLRALATALGLADTPADRLWRGDHLSAAKGA